MSALGNIAEQLKATGSRLGQQIQESPAYTQLQERYQSMEPRAQKISLFSGAALGLFMILFYPLSLFFASQNTMTIYEQKRTLMRDLFRTYRESSGQSNVTVPPPYETLKAAIDNIITQASLLPEQNIGMIESSAEGKLIPQNLVTHVLEVKLAKLNIKQIVDIGSSIVGISESVKLKDMIISAHAQDTRYFDVTFKLYSLNVPEPTIEAPPEIEKPVRGTKKAKDAEGVGE
ncbi:MAG: hypothetical protein H7328_02110 [Bdellovibrio sp.]|nr:hypothetical protein [Bdellovibrio sp.]